MKGLEVKVKISDTPMFSDLVELLVDIVGDARIPADVKDEISDRVNVLCDIYQTSSDLSHLKSLDADKRHWLEKNGYRPITEAVIHEWIGEAENAEHLYREAKSKFAVYKRYGKTVMPYSEKYLAEKSIEELMTKGGQYIS